MSDEGNDELFGVRRPVAYEGLMERLMRKMGFSLRSAQKEAKLRHKSIQRMMSHCAACGESEICRQMMDGDPHMKEPPAFCYNAKVLRKLARDLRAREDAEDTPPKPGESQ